MRRDFSETQDSSNASRTTFRTQVSANNSNISYNNINNTPVRFVTSYTPERIYRSLHFPNQSHIPVRRQFSTQNNSHILISKSQKPTIRVEFGPAKHSVFINPPIFHNTPGNIEFQQEIRAIISEERLKLAAILKARREEQEQSLRYFMSQQLKSLENKMCAKLQKSKQSWSEDLGGYFAALQAMLLLEYQSRTL